MYVANKSRRDSWLRRSLVFLDDKIHVRGRGRRNALTGQPNEGRKHGSGLRVGEMKKDSFNSHGVPFVAKCSGNRGLQQTISICIFEGIRE